MIIPCIDLQDGKAVQLVRGRRLALSVDDVLGLLDRFRDYPILHVIDLDAAMRKGSNSRWIKTLCQRGKNESARRRRHSHCRTRGKNPLLGRGENNCRQRRLRRRKDRRRNFSTRLAQARRPRRKSSSPSTPKTAASSSAAGRSG